MTVFVSQIPNHCKSQIINFFPKLFAAKISPGWQCVLCWGSGWHLPPGPGLWAQSGWSGNPPRVLLTGPECFPGAMYFQAPNRGRSLSCGPPSGARPLPHPLCLQDLEGMFEPLTVQHPGSRSTLPFLQTRALPFTEHSNSRCLISASGPNDRSSVLGHGSCSFHTFPSS